MKDQGVVVNRKTTNQILGEIFVMRLAIRLIWSLYGRRASRFGASNAPSAMMFAIGVAGLHIS